MNEAALASRARTKRWLAVAVPLGLFVSVAAVLWVMQSPVDRRALTTAERAALLTAQDLFAHSSQPELFEPARETTGREDLFDGSATLTAEYQSQNPPLYVVSHVVLERTAEAAHTTWQSLSVGGFMSLSVEAQDITLTPDDALFAWGDESKSQRLSMQGKPLGHFFVARRGARVFMVIFTGVYFDDGTALAALVTPKLEAMERLP